LVSWFIVRREHIRNPPIVPKEPEISNKGVKPTGEKDENGGKNKWVGLA